MEASEWIQSVNAWEEKQRQKREQEHREQETNRFNKLFEKCEMEIRAAVENHQRRAEINLVEYDSMGFYVENYLNPVRNAIEKKWNLFSKCTSRKEMHGQGDHKVVVYCLYFAPEKSGLPP